MRQESSAGSRIMVQRHGLVRDLTVCGLFMALAAVGVFIEIVIPVGADTMNLTLQWFFVLLAGPLLGFRRVFLSVSAYLLIGPVGTPVFARGGGLSCLICPTFGFLLGFALVAYVIGKLVEWVHAVKPRAYLFSAIVGYVIYHGMGTLYFYLITHFVVVTLDTVGWGVILAVYYLPTMIPGYILYTPAVTVAGCLRSSMGRLTK